MGSQVDFASFFSLTNNALGNIILIEFDGESHSYGRDRRYDELKDRNATTGASHSPT